MPTAIRRIGGTASIIIGTVGTGAMFAAIEAGGNGTALSSASIVATAWIANADRGIKSA
jgi:hypothetical protein